MLDRKLIRTNPDAVRSAIKDKGEKVDLDRFLESDENRRRLLSELDQLKHRKNVLSEEIGKLKREGKEASGQMEEVKDSPREQAKWRSGLNKWRSNLTIFT